MRTGILGVGFVAVLAGVLATPAVSQAQRAGGAGGRVGGVGVARPAVGGVGVARPGLTGNGPVLGGYGGLNSYYGAAYNGYRYPGYYGSGLGGYRAGYPLFLGLGSTVGVDPYNSNGYQMNYPPLNNPELAVPDANGVAVPVQVRVPAEKAEVWFSGGKTAQTGTVREFVSPPLAEGETYTYEIRARWIGPDGLIDQTRQIKVRPGQRVVVDFSVAQ